MPKRPLKQCAHYGCKELIEFGVRYCAKHHIDEKPFEGVSDRPSAAKRGYDANWDKARKTFLRQNPLCVKCKSHGKTTLASVVDHIKAHRGDRVLFWDMNNWQSLCVRCHTIKTRRDISIAG